MGAEAQKNTHKRFRMWLDTKYHNGLPTEEEWRCITEEDSVAECNYMAYDVSGVMDGEELEVEVLNELDDDAVAVEGAEGSNEVDERVPDMS